MVKRDSHYFNQNHLITCINALHGNFKTSSHRYASKWFDIREEIVRNLMWKLEGMKAVLHTGIKMRKFLEYAA